MNPWLLLFLTILSEVIGTISLRLSDGFTKLWPVAVVVVCYGLAFWGLSLVMRRLEIGITYAIWSGVGTVITAIAGVLLFQESVSLPKLAGIALIIAGVVLLHVSAQLR